MRRSLKAWKFKKDKSNESQDDNQSTTTTATTEATASLPKSEQSDPSLNSLQRPNTVHTPADIKIRIQVGNSTTSRLFQVDKQQLCRVSTFFQRLAFAPTDVPVDLPRDDPIAFELFINWLSTQDSHLPYEPLCYSEEPWRSKSVSAWLLAAHIKADTFELYALSQFISSCALVNIEAWQLIEKEAKEQSSLRRFSNHWIAWNCWLAAPSVSEYANLKASRFMAVINDNTRDPRTYDITHWYSPCGDDINPTCTHDPFARKVEAAKAARLVKRAKTTECEDDWEMMQNSVKTKTESRSK